MSTVINPVKISSITPKQINQASGAPSFEGGGNPIMRVVRSTPVKVGSILGLLATFAGFIWSGKTDCEIKNSMGNLLKPEIAQSLNQKGEIKFDDDLHVSAETMLKIRDAFQRTTGKDINLNMIQMILAKADQEKINACTVDFIQAQTLDEKMAVMVRYLESEGVDRDARVKAVEKMRPQIEELMKKNIDIETANIYLFLSFIVTAVLFSINLGEKLVELSDCMRQSREGFDIKG